MESQTIVVLGSKGVGKSSLVQHFSGNIKPIQKFGRDEYTMNFKANDVLYKLKIIDPSESYLSGLFQNAQNRLIMKGDAFIVVYSLDNLKSYCKAVDACLKIYKVKGSMDIPLVLVGNKADLQRRVEEHRLSLLDDLPMAFAQANTGLNVTPIFQLILFTIRKENIRLSMLKQSSMEFYSIASSS